MKYNRYLSSFVILFFAVILIVVPISAKSLYLQTQNYTIRAYDIGADGFSLTYQYNGSTPTWGGVGITLDGEHAVPILFMTYENQGYVEIMNATTMASLGTVNALGSSNLSGLAYDADNDRLYCVNRYGTILYVYDWIYATKTLTPVAGSPFSLTGTTGTYDLVLDQTNNTIYVSNATNVINVFNLNADGTTFSITPDVPITTTYVAVSLGIDEGYQYLYYGLGSTGGGTPIDLHLSQYNLSLGTESSHTLTGNGVVGLDVDQTNHNVYISTNGGDNLMVFDSALNPLNTISSGVSTPTGLVIPRTNISYNPLNLAKDSDVPGGQTRSNGQQITYTITYDNLSGASQVDNVTIVDQLPDEVDFVSATGGGTYSAGPRTVTWDIGNLPAADPGGSLTLVVQVNSTVPGTGKIVNSATIDSDHTPPTTVTNEVDWSSGAASIQYVVISGYVTFNGIGLEGVPITFSNSGLTATTDANGYYERYITKGWHGTSTLSMTGFYFTPGSYTYSGIQTNMPNQDFIGALDGVTISGFVFDRYNNPIEGASLSLSNGGGTVYTGSSGWYITSASSGWGGTLTASMGNLTFEPESYVYPVVTTNLTDQNFKEKYIMLGTEDDNSLPQDFVLLPAYPNPFNPSTTISYGLDNNSYVTINIYDITGQLITTLLNTEQTHGWHSINWNGTNQTGRQVPAGLYLSRITSDNEVKTAKLMLLK